MKILGIGNPFDHDPSAALVVGDEIVAAAEEERFVRKKHAAGHLPIESARYCLRAGGIEPEEIDIVAFPWSDESYRRHRWEGATRSFRKSPGKSTWKLIRTRRIIRRMKKRVTDTLRALDLDPDDVSIRLVDHHLAHASSCYHLSGFDEAAILSIDGHGEFTSTLIAAGKGLEIRRIKEILKPDSLGFFYSTITEYLGFRRNNGEFKVMGMASYGDPDKVDVSDLIWMEDGTYRVNDEYIWVDRRKRYERQKMFSRSLVERWGPPRTDEGLAEPYIDIAAAAQKALETIVIGLMEHHLSEELERHGRLCLAGGCALNVRMNRKLLEHPLVNEIYVQPAAHDAGAPLGAATWCLAESGTRPKPMHHPYLGPAYEPEAIAEVLERFRIKHERFEDREALIEAACNRLVDGKIVAWFQGRMEYGPRALGNRSILGHPAREGVADEINRRIKFREPWRPFCPSMLADAAPPILGSDHPSPFMNLSFTITDEWQKKIPEAVHVDGSARPQTVTAEENPLFHALLTRFQETTGIGVLMNTSLNRRGEPMVCSPEDALQMFYGSGLEHLFLGPFLIEK